MMNRQIVLRSRPESSPTPDNFELVSVALPPITDGGVLRRTIYLSLDPYMRGRMSDAESYAASVAIRQVMVGGTVSQVIESKNPAFAAGDVVLGYDGWQDFGLSKGLELRKLDPSSAPISTALGTLGMPGLTGMSDCSISVNRSQEKRWSSPPRQGRLAASLDRSPRSKAAGRLALPARPTNAGTSSMNWDSTRA